MREEEEKRSQRLSTGNPIKGPIGLSLMVTVSVLWMDHTMTLAVKLAKTRCIAVPRLIFTYVDEEEEQGFIVQTKGRYGQQRLSLHPKYIQLIIDFSRESVIPLIR